MDPNEPSPDSNYIDFDYEPWWRRRWFRWVLGVVVLLIVGAAVAAVPAWRAVKAMRAQTYSKEGEQFLAGNQLTEAFDRSRLGLQLKPGDRRLTQLAAGVLTRAGSPQGLTYWRQLMEAPDGTTEDRQAYSELALALDQPQLVEPELTKLLAVSNPPPRSLLIATRYHLLMNNPTAALEQARALVRADAGNPTNLLGLASLLDARPEADSMNEARNVLLQVARGTGPFRLDAMEALINRPGANRADREQVAAMLAQVTNPSIREQVLLADARMRLDPSMTRTLAVATLERIKPSTDAEIVDVAFWLQRHQLFDKSLDLLTPNRVQRNHLLFRSRLAALVGVGQVASAYREALHDQPGADPLEMELDRFRLASLLKDADAVQVHQDRLVRSANRDPVRMRRVAEFAEANGLDDLAQVAWKTLTAESLEAPRAIRSLAALADASGDTWAARDYARRLALLEKDNAFVQLQVAHYDLLLGENLAQALGVAESVVNQPQFRVHARLVAAFGHFKLGEPERARAEFSKVGVPAAALPIHLRALYVALEGALGSGSEARAIAATLPLASLRPEERELVRAYLSLQRPATP